MKIHEILVESILLEGGAALKNVVGITQEEAKKAIPDLLKKIAHELHIDKSLVKVIGSAGRKPADAVSGDIDIAVQAKVSEVDAVLSRLAKDKNCRAMPGINVYSFAYPVGKKLVQVDLIPVANIEFAVWSYMAPEADLKQGLKGAHRNELFFAVTRHADLVKKDLDEDGEVDEIERYFYDLSKGLLRGKQSRAAKKNGKFLKGFKTIEKNLVASTPEEVCKILFGPKVTPAQTSTFEGTLKAINAPGFPHAADREAIIKMAINGITKKGLKVPSSLELTA